MYLLPNNSTVILLFYCLVCMHEIILHCESKNMPLYSFCNFAECWPIFKILSLTDSAVNLSLSLKVFWKSVNIRRSYRLKYSGMFFWLTVYLYALSCYFILLWRSYNSIHTQKKFCIYVKHACPSIRNNFILISFTLHKSKQQYIIGCISWA